MKIDIKTVKNNRIIRMASAVLIAALLMLPVKRIEQLIVERQQYHQSVSDGLQRDWGGEQVLHGPFLVVPYAYMSDEGTEMEQPSSSAVFIPDDLSISNELTPRYKYRGMYKHIVYQNQVQVSGSFANLSPQLLDGEKIDLDEAVFQWDKAVMKYFVKDLKALANNVQVEWNAQNYRVNPMLQKLKGTSGQHVHYEGFKAQVPVDLSTSNSFQFTLELKGSTSLSFVPLASYTTVRMRSDWPSPKFTGEYLPDSSEVNDDGFQAEWNISGLNRPLKSAWLGMMDLQQTDKYAFGVELLEPVDTYQKTMRAAKYAILFIVLTFVGLFFAELFTNNPATLLQYILTGFALVLFYSLLLSLTEHMRFGQAYLVASSSIVLLISVYAYSLSRNLRSTFALLFMWSALYAYLYFILQLADFALLAGNIGLFVILAVIMFASRRLRHDDPDDSTQTNSVIVDNGDLL